MRLFVQRLRVQVPAMLTARGAFAGSGSTRTLRYAAQQSAIREVVRESECASDDASAPSRPLFERSWTLSGSAPLEKLKLRVPGVTFLTVDDDATDDDGTDSNGDDVDVVARVRVTSDSAAVLEHVTVVSRVPHRTLIEWTAPWHGNTLPSHANLLTEVSLTRRGMLRNIASSGDGLVIVNDDDALALQCHGADIKFATAHNSRLAVTTTRDVNVCAMRIASAQQSCVYVRAPIVRVRDALQVAAAGGSAQVHLQTLALLQAPEMSLATAGHSPVVCVASAAVAVKRLQSAIAGCGSITVTSSSTASAAACASQSIAIFGSGAVDCADVTTEHAAIASMGESRVAVAATHELKLTALGRAAVLYPSAAPATVTASKDNRGESRVAHMSDAARSDRAHQHKREREAREQFWQSLPTRESAMDVAHQVPLRRSGFRLWGGLASLIGDRTDRA